MSEARSRTSSGGGSQDPVIRSRTWSSDIVKAWNIQVGQVEGIEDRMNRYRTYFTMTDEQLKSMYEKFVEEVNLGLRLHRDDPDAPWKLEKCSLKMLDTCVEHVPTGQEKATAYALDFGGSNLRAVRVKLEGGGKLSIQQSKSILKEMGEPLKKGLLDKDATATQLFDAFAEQMKDLMAKYGDSSPGVGHWFGVGFTFSFPMFQQHLKHGELIIWTKEFETGRNTNDPVEAMDVNFLLDQAFWRKEVCAKSVAVLNDTTGTLLSAAYERPANKPPCLIGVILGTGVNGCYFQENAKEWGYKGSIINTEFACFDKGLPYNDVDLEVDFAYEANRGHAAFEKCISAGYLGEVCRRLIVRVFQKDAPAIAWVRESLPPDACSYIMKDEGADITKQILQALWDWDANAESLLIVKALVKLVFDRSAALAAVAIAALAKKTGRLSPATGGLSCGIDGSLYTQNPWYQDRVRYYLDRTLGPETAKCIYCTVSTDGSGKGAAILAGTIMAQQQNDSK